MKEQINSDVQKPVTESNKKKKGLLLLRTLLTLYGVLYLVFIIDTFNAAGLYDMYDPENITVNLAFILFIGGYFVSWRNAGLAGIIFIVWWAVMWYLALFIVDHDKGSGVVMGLPLFILGILFIISWYRKKGAETSVSGIEPEIKTPGQ